MSSVGTFLLAGMAAGVYLAVVVATLTGAVRAFHERYLPPWVVGLVGAFLLMWLHQLLGAPLGNFGGVVAVAAGIVAGAVYGLGRRRAMHGKSIS